MSIFSSKPKINEKNNYVGKMIVTLLTQQLQEIPHVASIEAVDLYRWIISSLIIVLIGLATYFKMECKNLNKELKQERNYSRTQGDKNIALIQSVNMILTQLVKTTDKTAEDSNDIFHFCKDIDPIVKSNVVKLDQIKIDIMNLRNDGK